MASDLHGDRRVATDATMWHLVLLHLLQHCGAN
jgi:hypothetical protein